MIKFYKIFTILSIIWLSFNPADQHNQTNICNVTVYYESFCMMSRKFMSQVLPEAYAELKNSLIINPIPYGAAQTKVNNGKYSFTCQHGPEECKGNIIQGCACYVIQNNYKGNSTPSLVQVLGHFMGIKPPYSNNTSQYFLIKDKRMQKQFADCMNSDKKNKIMAEYGKLTAEEQPSGVPWVLINGIRDPEAPGNLTQACCKVIKKMPVKCKRDCEKNGTSW